MANIQTIELCDDVHELISDLRQCMADWAANVARMAAIVRRLDELGAEVSIENSLLPYIRLIAHGQLSPSAFTNLSCDPTLLDRVMRLPLPLQEKAADNEPFKVMELNGDHRMVRPLDMTPRERRQVFCRTRLRSDAEQVGWLREQIEKETAKSMVSERQISIDKRRRGIVANGVFISLAELAGYVSALSR